MNSNRSGRLVTIGFYFVFIIFFALIAFRYDPGEDVWYDIKTGQIILQTHQVPHKNLYSFTEKNKKWVDEQWLSQVIFAAIFKIGNSIKSLYFFRFLIFVAIFLLLDALLKKQGIGYWLRFFVLIFPVAMFYDRGYVRTFLFTSLFLTLTLYILFLKNRHLFYLPLIILLWANLHPGFIVGLAVIESFLAVEVIRDIYTKAEWREFYKKVLIMILSFVAVFINPYGAHIFSVLFATTRQTILLRVVEEWQKLRYEPNNVVVNLTYFYILLASISALYIIKQIATSKNYKVFFNNLKFLILLIFGFYLVAMAYRNVQLFFLLTILPVAISMRTLISDKKALRKIVLVITFILVSILLGTFTDKVILKPSKDWFRREYPVGVCDFIRRNHLRGNLYNQYNDGYYLLYRLYPDVKVSIYSTFSIHDEVSFLTNEMNLLHPSKDLKFLDEMNVNMVLLNYGYSSSSPIFYFLYSNPNWALVYWDDFGMLFLRNTVEYSDVIRKNEYKYAIPIESIEYNLIKEGKTAEIMKEIDRKIKENPHCLKALSILSSINLMKNNLFEVIKINKRISKIAPLHDGAYFNIGYALLQTGQYSAAERYLKKAIKLNRKNPEFYVQLGYAFIGQKKFHKAKLQFLKALQLDYTYKNAYLGLSKLYLLLGNLSRAKRLFETYNHLARSDY